MGERKWKSIAAGELAAKIRHDPLVLLDVREPGEFAGARLAGSLLMPLRVIDGAVAELDRTAPIVCICRSGKRAAEAARKLTAMGFGDVTCLDGGVLAWQEAGLPIERDEKAPWPLERQVRLAAGLFVLAGLALSLRFPLAIGLVWFVGAGLTFAGLTDCCGMGMLLARAPWNQRKNFGPCSTSCCSRGVNGK